MRFSLPMLRRVGAQIYEKLATSGRLGKREIFVNFVGQLTVRAMTLLELETQYANLTPSGASEFIQSIRAVDKDPDVSTLLLVGKLEQFIAKFRAEGKRICASGASMSQDDRDRLTLHGRIIAAFLVILHRTNSVSALREYTLLFLEYASAVVRTKYDYLSTALDVISYRITALGIDYHVVRDTSSLDLLSYKLIEGLRFDKTRGETFSFQGWGRVLCRDGKLSVCSSDALESGAKAFSICGERVSVMTRNIRDEKLKSTEQFDAGALRSFADTFLRSLLRRYVPSRPERERPERGGEARVPEWRGGGHSAA